MIKAVVDTNTIVSATISPKGLSGRVYQAWLEGKFTLVTSPPVIGEIARVHNYDRIRKKYGLDFIVTGDKPFQARGEFEGIRIISPRLFLEFWKATPISLELWPRACVPGTEKVVRAARWVGGPNKSRLSESTELGKKLALLDWSFS